MDERAVLAEHLRRIVGSRLLDALDILFDPDELSGEGERLRELLTARSRSWADILSGEDGRAAARRAGHPAAVAVPVPVAAAMLGITRQGVHDLIRRRKLDRDPDGPVTTASIQGRLSRSRGGQPGTT